MRTSIRNVVLSLICLLATSTAWSIDIYVDADAPGVGDGTSWFDGYRYLQDALARAHAGDTIKVSAGTYRPDQGVSVSNDDRFAGFEIPSNVRVMGGYAGYSSLPTWQWDTRNSELYESILSGDLKGNDTVFDVNNSSAHGLRITSSQRQDNSHTIVFLMNASLGTELNGFTISGGNANSTDTSGPQYQNGAGIFCQNGAPRIANCRIESCTSLVAGGGMYNQASDPNIQSCVFIGNYAMKYGAAMYNSASNATIGKCVFQSNNGDWLGKGAGMYNDQSSPTIQDCTFLMNKGMGSGIGMFNTKSHPKVKNCLFQQNKGVSKGGGVASEKESHPEFVNCIFARNDGGGRAGATFDLNGKPSYIGCSFMGNKAGDEGGAMYYTHSDPKLYNCVFHANSAVNYGGAISCYDANIDIINCTFSANLADAGRAIACTSFSNSNRSFLTITNSILWDNGDEIFTNDGSETDMTYTNSYKYWPGSTNHRDAPRFTNQRGPDGLAGTADDDLSLSAGSPGIDSGNNSALPAFLTTDRAGVPRFIDDPDTTDDGKGLAPIVDRGAYEFGAAGNLAPPTAHAGADQSVSAPVGGAANVQLDGSLSQDPDGDTLAYDWTWTVGNQAFSATGMRPKIDLPVGQHAIALVVSDGIYASEADVVSVDVIAVGSRPVANAGPDQSHMSDSGGQILVSLNGSGSYDLDGDALQYTWSWVIDNQTVQTTGVNPTIQLPLGQYTVQLVVFDGTYYSSVDTVVITVAQQNRAPVAHAGADQVVTAALNGLASVSLNGSGSSDADGDALQYTWTWTLNSQSYQTTLKNPNIQLPIGQHMVELVVFDGNFYSSVDTVRITVTESDHAPVAQAGPDQIVTADPSGFAPVTLDGSGSSDLDGDSLQYTWTWRVNGQTITTAGVHPSLQLAVGQYAIELVVFDGSNTSSPDTVTITVVSAGNRPVAHAGPDQTVATGTSTQVTVVLDGTSSYDPDGDSLQYDWIINSQTFKNVGARPSVLFPLGRHTVELVVTDGAQYSLPDTVVITILQGGTRPIADAGPDQSVAASSQGQASVTLNGSGSNDPDGDPLSYTWRWTVNSQVYQTVGVAPTIQLPVGVHSIELTVYDGTAYSQSDTVQITVQHAAGNRPVANAGPDQNVVASQQGLASVTLNGSGSYDPDGSFLSYAWKWTINNQTFQTTGAAPTIQLPVGQYTVELTVYDGSSYSLADAVTITVQFSGNRPVANAGPDQTVVATFQGHATVTLNGAGSYDPDGDTLAHTWTWTIANRTYQTTGVSPTIQLPVGQYTIELVVNDGTYSSSPDTVQITVTFSGTSPVAQAGPDQNHFVAPGKQVSLNLDASGSYDPDGDSLDYVWTWTIGNQPYQATGVGPAIQLPVGQHVIQLVVFDGTYYSTADEVMITVNELSVGRLSIWPYVVTRTDTSKYILAIVKLSHVQASQVSVNTPSLLYPGGIPSVAQQAYQDDDGTSATVFIMFDEEDLLMAVPENGNISVTVIGQFLSGQPFSAESVVILNH
jgi:predicted outer membrane repeat protein